MAAARTADQEPGQAGQPAGAAAEDLGPKYADETHYLRQYMAQLRRKLELDPARPRHLLTELGMGYRFQP
jgi:two-component system KDP operon response regulator KdpE